MITSKQRAYLRGLANTTEPIFQIGKGGVTPEMTDSISEALEKRELIKITVLNNCDDDPKDLARTISGRTRSEIVQIIGKKIVVFRPSKKKIIELPK